MSKNRNPPTPPESSNPPDLLAGGDSASADLDRPGLSELQDLAGGDAGADTGQPPPPRRSASLPAWHPGIFEGPIEDRHRQMARGLMGAICGGVEMFAPIRYSDAQNGIKAKGAEELAPLCAKYEAIMPLWYQEWREEIRAGIFLASFIGASVQEVKRVEAVEAQIKELVDQARARDPSITLQRARREACITLGLPVEGDAAAQGASQTH